MSSILYSELMRIRDRHGELIAPVVVDEARPENAPLHTHFIWDDSIAGERYREQQARELIRSVMIVYKETERGKSSVRAFVNVSKSETNARHYVPTDEALSDPMTRDLVLLEYRRSLHELKVRYGHLSEYAALLAEHLAEVTTA